MVDSGAHIAYITCMQQMYYYKQHKAAAQAQGFKPLRPLQFLSRTWRAIQ